MTATANPIGRILQTVSILALLLNGITAKAELPPSLVSSLQLTLDSNIQRDRFTPGASLCISKPGEAPIALTTGVNRKGRRGRGVKADDTFRLASITKSYVAALVLKSAESGEINLNQRAAAYLHERLDIQSLPNGDSVTIRQLLAMRSGIRDYLETAQFEEIFENEPQRRWSADAAIHTLYNSTPLFAAGSRYYYSNSNYLLLQLILNEVSNRQFPRLMRHRLLSPNGLHKTFVEFESPKRRLTTHGYERDGSRLVDVTSNNDGLGLADGGVVATACDVAKFINALFYDRSILSQRSLNKMLRFSKDNDYGLGVERELTEWGLAWTHNGTSSGFQGQYYYFPETGLTWVLLTNSLDTEIIEPVFAETMAQLS